jgi:hypothetical protein
LKVFASGEIPTSIMPLSGKSTENQSARLS